jgi:hypothetical protein
MQYDILLDDFLDILSNLGVNVSKLSIEDEDSDMLLSQDFVISESSYLGITKNSFKNKTTEPNWSSGFIFEPSSITNVFATETDSI